MFQFQYFNIIVSKPKATYQCFNEIAFWRWSVVVLDRETGNRQQEGDIDRIMSGKREKEGNVRL